MQQQGLLTVAESSPSIEFLSIEHIRIAISNVKLPNTLSHFKTQPWQPRHLEDEVFTTEREI